MCARACPFLRGLLLAGWLVGPAVLPVTAQDEDPPAVMEMTPDQQEKLLEAAPPAAESPAVTEAIPAAAEIAAPAPQMTKEDSLLKILEEVDSELGSLKDKEQNIMQVGQPAGMSINAEERRASEAQLLQLLGLSEGSLPDYVWKVKNSINELEQKKRDLIERLIKEKIKLSNDLPFLERDVENSLKMQMERYEAFLSQHPQSEFADNILFRLADFYYKKAEERYELELEKYDVEQEAYLRDDSLFRAGKLSLEPKAPADPKKDFGRSVTYCKRIVADYPQSDVRDDALYNLAYFLEQEQNYEAARDMYVQLVTERPQSRYAPEAHLRIGEYYFDHPEADSGRGLEHAVTSYKDLLNYWNHINFSVALYKLGWTYYRMSEFKDAISYFVYLLDDTRRIQEGGVTALKKYDFEKEAVRYVAMSFREGVSEAVLLSETPWQGVPEKVRKFVRQINDRSYAPLIVEELGNVYKEIDQNIGAVEAYQVLLEEFPDYPSAYKIQAGITELYDRLASDPDVIKRYGKEWAFDHANDSRLKQFKNYGRPWIETNLQNPTVRQEALKLAKDNIYFVARYHFEKAQKSRDPQEYELAIAYFRQFLVDFPEGEQAYDVRWIIAMTLDTELKRPDEAVAEYLQVSRDAQFTVHREDAANNAVALTDELRKKATEQGGTPAATLISEEQNYLAALDNFMDLMPDHASVPELLNNKAAVYYNREMFEEAKAVYDVLIQRYPKRRETIDAYKLIATAYANRGHYERAIDWFKRWREVTDKPEEQQSADNFIAQNLRKIAEQHQAKGDHLAAAQAYERVVAEQPNYIYAARTLFDAAQQYDSIPDLRHAAILYQQIVMNYPGWEYAPDALYNAALAFDKNNDKRQAAQIYEQLAKIYPAYKNANNAIYNTYLKYEEIEDWRNAARVLEWFVEVNPNDDEAKDLLFKAGKYYGKVGDDRKAQEVFAKFSQKYPNDTRVIEIQYELAMALYRKEKFPEAKVKLGDVIKAYNAAGKPADYKHRAAEAQYLVTEMDYKDYAAIQFKQPEAALNGAIKQKSDLLKSMNEKYAQVADYGIINWTPEAIYKIARNYEDFANAFENQELPLNLAKEDGIKKQKTIKLSLSVYLSKALEPYNAVINMQGQLKGNPGIDTMIIPWVIKAKKKKLESMYRIAIANKEAQMSELQLLAPQDTSAKAIVINMKTLQKVGKQLLVKAQPSFEQCFAVAESLGLKVREQDQVGQGVSVSLLDLMQTMLSSGKGGTTDTTAAPGPEAETDSIEGPEQDTTGADTSVAVAPVTPTDTLAQRLAATVDISRDLEMLALVHNAKVELSHLMYTAADLNVKGAIQFLSLPVPPELKKTPVLLNEYKKKVAQSGIQFLKPGLSSLAEGLQVARAYNIRSKWVDKAKQELLKYSNIAPERFAELTFENLENFRTYAALYRQLYETGNTTPDGQDAFAVQDLLGQFADYGKSFGKVAFQTYHNTLILAQDNNIKGQALRQAKDDFAKFVYTVSSQFEDVSQVCGGVADLYKRYTEDDPGVKDSVPADLDKTVAEDMMYVFTDQKDIFNDYCIEMYEEGYLLLKEDNVKNEWMDKVRKKLGQLLPDVYGAEAGIQLVVEHVVSDTGWRMTARADSQWFAAKLQDETWGMGTRADLADTIPVTGFDTSAAVPVWNAERTDTVFARKHFIITHVPKKGKLLVTARNFFRVYLNEVYIAKEDTGLDGWRQAKSYDVGDYLRRGENLLCIIAEHREGGFGFMADLEIKSEPVESTETVTDEDSGTTAETVPETTAQAPPVAPSADTVGADSVQAPAVQFVTQPAADTTVAADPAPAPAVTETPVPVVAPDAETSAAAAKPLTQQQVLRETAASRARESQALTAIEQETQAIVALKVELAQVDSLIGAVKGEITVLTTELEKLNAPPPAPKPAPAPAGTGQKKKKKK
jgi:tetratricopeptide (TPR) repeat protein